MNRLDGLTELRRANPRFTPHFVDAVNGAERCRHTPWLGSPAPRRRRRPFLLRPAAAAAATGVVTVVVVLVVAGAPFGTSPANVASAMQQAVAVTADAADASGTASVTVEKDGAVWAAKTVRWHGVDLSVTDGYPTRAARGELRVVNGRMYSPDPEGSGAWLDLGSPDSIDPGSGTTPDDYLQVVREDAGGETLRRVTGAMADLQTRRASDGSTVYRGTVAAGVLARQAGMKGDQPTRILPYGYVAHDAAADPTSTIGVSITVGPDNTIRQLEARWGGGAAWTFRVTFSQLGTTPAPALPDNIRPLNRCVTPSGQVRSTC